MTPPRREESNPSSNGEDRQAKIERLADDPDLGIVREFYDFLKTNKKWWLSPILIILAVLMLFVVMSLSPAAPFIYTLF